MAIFGTDTRAGARVSFSVKFNGTANRWSGDEIVEVSSLNNGGDTVLSKRRISDLSFSLYDSSGTIWNEMGHGTSMFNKEIELRVYVGGTYGAVSNGNGTEFKYLGTAGAGTFLVHKGEIVGISKHRKVLTIRSENKLNKVKHLKWQMPVRTYNTGFELYKYYGSFCFYNTTSFVEAYDIWYGTLTPYCLYNIEDNGRKGEMYAHTHSGLTPSDYAGTGIYDTTGTGITDFLASGFEFLDTRFHQAYPAKKFKGTFMEAYYGELDTEILARSHGFSDLAAAEAARSGGTDTGTYTINHIRLEFGTEINSTEREIYEAQLIRMEGDPVAVIRHCLFGKMVSDFLNRTTDEGASFGTSQRTLAFQRFQQTINPEDSFVSEYISDALEVTSSIFFVNNNNQFDLVAYGPLDFSQSLSAYGTDQILDTSFSNDISDYYNKVKLNYSWDFNEEKFSKSKVGTLAEWSVTNERIFELDSKWIEKDSLVDDLVVKLLSRFGRTSPEITVDFSLELSGRDLGGLISISDPNTFVGTKIVQLLEYDKDFGGSKRISFKCLDGNSLYRRNGYARWGPGITLTGVVSGTSRSGWGNAALGASSGTVHNIATSLYGTHFIFW